MPFVYFSFPSSKLKDIIMSSMYQELMKAPPNKVAAYIRNLEALLAESDGQIDDIRRTTKAMTESFQALKEEGESRAAVLLDEIASLGGAPVVRVKDEARSGDRKRGHSPTSPE